MNLDSFPFLPSFAPPLEIHSNSPGNTGPKGIGTSSSLILIPPPTPIGGEGGGQSMHLANASGSKVRERESVPVYKCQVAGGYHSNSSRVLQWAALHRGAGNPFFNIWAFAVHTGS